MSYQESFTIHLGSGQTGKVLSGQLYNPNNTTNGSAITTGFAEIGSGDYVLSTALPDQFQGYLNVYVSGAGYVATGSVNNNLPNNVGYWSGTSVGPLVVPTNAISTADMQKFAKLKYNCDGTVWFVSPTGTGTDGLTWATAKTSLEQTVSGAAYNDAVVFDGTFAINYTVQPPSGTRVYGTSPTTAIITFSGQGSGSGEYNTLFIPNTNGYYRDFSLLIDPRVEVYDACIATQAWRVTPFSAPIGWTFENVFCSGWSDNVYELGGQGTFKNCHFASAYDTCNSLSGNFLFDNCITTIVGASGTQDVCRAFSNINGNLIIRNGYISVTASSYAGGVNSFAYGIYAGNTSVFSPNSAKISVQNTIITTFAGVSDGATGNFDILNKDLINPVYLCNVTYNPANSSGLIVYAPPLQYLDTDIASGFNNLSGQEQNNYNNLYSGITGIETTTNQFTFTSGDVNAYAVNFSGTDLSSLTSGISDIETALTALKQQLSSKVIKLI
jgi:hypothetical protein